VIVMDRSDKMFALMITLAAADITLFLLGLISIDFAQSYGIAPTFAVYVIEWI